jgi:hypothetical protein
LHPVTSTIKAAAAEIKPAVPDITSRLLLLCILVLACGVHFRKMFYDGKIAPTQVAYINLVSYFFQYRDTCI